MSSSNSPQKDTHNLPDDGELPKPMEETPREVRDATGQNVPSGIQNVRREIRRQLQEPPWIATMEGTGEDLLRQCLPVGRDFVRKNILHYADPTHPFSQKFAAELAMYSCSQALLDHLNLFETPFSDHLICLLVRYHKQDVLAETMRQNPHVFRLPLSDTFIQSDAARYVNLKPFIDTYPDLFVPSKLVRDLRQELTLERRRGPLGEEVALADLDKGFGSYVGSHLWHYKIKGKYFSSELAQRLTLQGYPSAVYEHLSWFRKISKDVAYACILHGKELAVSEHLFNFEKLDMPLALALLDAKGTHSEDRYEGGYAFAASSYGSVQVRDTFQIYSNVMEKQKYFQDFDEAAFETKYQMVNNEVKVNRKQN